MPLARIEARRLDDVGVLMPDVLVVVAPPIGRIKKRHAVHHEPDRPEDPRAGLGPALLLRRKRTLNVKF
jgi:hypothetical protein